MLREVLNRSPWLLAGFIPYKSMVDQDVISPTSKTAQEILKNRPKEDKETGMDRIYMMFSVE
jgi:hypothetical protein